MIDHKVSVEALETRLRRTVWGPVLLVTCIATAAAAYVLFQEHQKNWALLQVELSRSLESQEHSLSEELFLSQAEAIQLRLEEVLKDWSRTNPQAPICISLVPLDPINDLRAFGRCSDGQSSVHWQRQASEKMLFIGSKPIASLRYGVVHQTTLADLFPPRLILAVLFAAFLAWILQSYLVRRLKASILFPLLDRIAEDERHALVAQTIQMLAHDVRKPIYLMKLALGGLKNTKTKEEFEERRPQFLEEVEKALFAADGMLSDILKLGEPTDSGGEETSLPEAIRRTLGDIFRIYPHAQIHLHYDLSHRSKLKADANRIVRVLFNLIENAIQVMSGSGDLWLESREREDFIEITVANNGPAIPEKDRIRLFTPFFSKRKGGTGLGLAAAKNVIEDLGGKIRCRSEKKRTEFHFTIPRANEPDSDLGGLPSHSREFASSRSEILITQATPHHSQEQPILIFDDDNLIHSVWDMSHGKNASLRLYHYRSWEDFTQRGAQIPGPATVAFVDLHFKGSDFDGIAIAEKLRQRGITRIYAVTADAPILTSSQAFDAIFDKDVVHSPRLDELLRPPGETLVRPALVRDAGGIARVLVDARKEVNRGLVPDSYLQSLNYEDRTQRWKQRLAEPETRELTLVGVDAKEEVLGFAHAGNNTAHRDRFDAELYEIYLARESRRKGLGRRLVAELARELRAAGFHSLEVCVLVGNPNRDFYPSIGAKLVEIATKPIGETQCEVAYYVWENLEELGKIDRS